MERNIDLKVRRLRAAKKRAELELEIRTIAMWFPPDLIDAMLAGQDELWSANVRSTLEGGALTKICDEGLEAMIILLNAWKKTGGK